MMLSNKKLESFLRRCVSVRMQKAKTNQALDSMAVQQTGAVLVISLIMLLLLTIIGVSTSQTALLEERMAGSMRNENNAFQSAEAALREAESYLSGPTIGNFDSNGSNGLYSETGKPPGPNDDWSKFNTVAFDLQKDDAMPAALYVIQRIASSGTGPNQTFAVTARAVSANDAAVVVVQSTYLR